MRRLIYLLLILTPLVAHGATHTGLAPRAGTLLVATEQIGDPRFHQSVILITHHDRYRTSGLILNRQLGKLPADLEDTLSTLPNGIFWGGPVAPLQVSALLLGAQEPHDKQLAPGLQLLSGKQLGELLHWSPHTDGELRVYLGYAGWGATQLAAEITRGDWTVLPLNLDTVQNFSSERLWQQLTPAPSSPWI